MHQPRPRATNETTPSNYLMGGKCYSMWMNKWIFSQPHVVEMAISTNNNVLKTVFTLNWLKVYVYSHSEGLRV